MLVQYTCSGPGMVVICEVNITCISTVLFNREINIYVPMQKECKELLPVPSHGPRFIFKTILAHQCKTCYNVSCIGDNLELSWVGGGI